MGVRLSNKLVRISSLVFVIVLLHSGLSGVVGSELNTTDSTNNSISVNIQDAWYADGENDSKENDVFVVLQFQLSSNNDINSFSYVITLTLPSGASYSYCVVVYTNMKDVTLTNNFWNHATETGWYHVEVHAQLNTWDNPSDSADHIFDPPGGDGSDPTKFTVG